MKKNGVSVQPEWCKELPFQQQSVLLLAARGPDGVPKNHPCKVIQRAYRASVLIQARTGKELTISDDGDSFMGLESLRNMYAWSSAMKKFFDTVDSLPLHFVTHLMLGSEILGYKHPKLSIRDFWYIFYNRCVENFHLNPETEEEMDKRLSDFQSEDNEQF